MSKTVLCLVLLRVSKHFELVQFFVAYQKLIYILCQSQTFCARPKDNFHVVNSCLVLLQVPKCFVPVQIFWTRPKIELNFSAFPKSFVPVKKLNLLYENHLLVWHKKFGTGTIYKSVFVMAQKIWTSPKYFGTRKRRRHKSIRYFQGNKFAVS